MPNFNEGAVPAQGKMEGKNLTAHVESLLKDALEKAKVAARVRELSEPAKTAIERDGPLLCEMIAYTWEHGTRKESDTELAKRFEETLASIIKKGQVGDIEDLRHGFPKDASIYLGTFKDKMQKELNLGTHKISGPVGGGMGPWGTQFQFSKELLAQNPKVIAYVVGSREFLLDTLFVNLDIGTATGAAARDNFGQYMEGLEANHHIKRLVVERLDDRLGNKLLSGLGETGVEELVIRDTYSFDLYSLSQMLPTFEKLKRLDLSNMKGSAVMSPRLRQQIMKAGNQIGCSIIFPPEKN